MRSRKDAVVRLVTDEPEALTQWRYDYQCEDALGTFEDFVFTGLSRGYGLRTEQAPDGEWFASIKD